MASEPEWPAARVAQAVLREHSPRDDEQPPPTRLDGRGDSLAAGPTRPVRNSAAVARREQGCGARLSCIKSDAIGRPNRVAGLDLSQIGASMPD